MERAIELAIANVRSARGGPFGAVVVRDGQMVGEGANSVTASNDPTAHAEVLAIRDACSRLGTFNLSGCEVYTSCEPCPMCLGAIYWARLDRIWFACTQADAREAGFDDAFIYEQIPLDPSERSIPSRREGRERGLAAFAEWKRSAGRVSY